VCIDDDYGPEFWAEKTRTARKGHKCCACGEKIRPKDKYNYMSGMWDGSFSTFKHCLRCYEVFTILMSESENGETVDLLLNCGETYEGENSRMYELAFSVPGDFNGT